MTSGGRGSTVIFQIRTNDRVLAIGSAAELRALHEELTFDLGEKRGKPNRMCLYDPIGQSFAIGLLTEAESAMRSRGIPVLRNDFRRRPAQRRGLPLSWLLPHQRGAVDAAIDRAVLCIDVPTAGGKGEIIAAIVGEVLCEWLVLCDDRKVLHQLGGPHYQDPAKKSGRIALRTGEAPGRIGDGIWEADRRVTVASPATLDQHWDGERWSDAVLALFRRVRGLIYDEVHMSGSPRSQRILRELGGCYWRIGTSATIDGRSDKRDASVRAQFGPVGYRVPAQELEAQGIIATQKIRMVRCDQPDTAHYDAGGYQRAISLSKTRNAVVAKIWLRKRTGVLTFVRELDHGRYLLRCAEHLGLRAEFVHGEHKTAERDAILERFERGETAILICSDVFRQGADIIHAYTSINAAGGASPIGATQRRGRAGRICRAVDCPRCAEMGKKDSAEVYDVYDTDSLAEERRRVHRQRLPGLWLRRHAEARLRAYQEKGALVEMIGVEEI